jgi:hypothetical protein
MVFDSLAAAPGVSAVLDNVTTMLLMGQCSCVHVQIETQAELNLLFDLLAAAAGVSAFLDNVTTMLLMGPITISMMKTANGRDPRPMLMAQVKAAPRSFYVSWACMAALIGMRHGLSGCFVCTASHQCALVPKQMRATHSSCMRDTWQCIALSWEGVCNCAVHLHACSACV